MTATTKISELTASSGVSAGDVLVTVKNISGTNSTRKATAAQLAEFVTASISSLSVTSITGSLFGTASFATNAASAVNAVNATNATNATNAANATTANALQTARTISSTGDVTWSVTFDGSGNVSGAAAIGAGVIVDADINSAAAIADTKLATISTAGKVSNSATTATSTNTAHAIVARDASGNFSAGTITATTLAAANSNITGDLVVGGRITAQEYITEFVSASVIYESGSTKFGNDSEDTHQFSGSILLNGTLSANNTVSGTVAQFTSITGTLSNLTTNVVRVTSNATLNSTQHIILASASNADITLTLPSTSTSAFRQYVVKKIDPTAFKIIVSGAVGQSIDGVAGKEIGTQFESLTFVSDGTSNWYII